MDTRAEFQVGPRSTPIGAGQTHTVSAHGTNGDCSIPNDARALVLNVTAVGATAPTFLTIWGDGSRPTASSLNPSPGQPPVPNAVTTDLTNAAGQFRVFNLQGSVDVLADVVGYYADHDHDDRYYRKEVIDQRAPQVNTITVASAAFTATDSDLAVIKSSSIPGDAGAYVVAGSGGIDRLVAPLVLPNGVTVTDITVHHFDDSGTANMQFGLRCERLDPPGQVSSRASAGSSSTAGWGSVQMTSLPEVIDTAECAYFLEVIADWDALDAPEDLRILAFEIIYQTAG
ncbi:hypothetical protein [Ilumatobacter sp.]|uniref:hypothetical protein n=1 Tax=Ilumatobacter sp. TaxID=1967498 RepID=UPI003AF53957